MSPSSLLSLPNEVLVMILRLLPLKDLHLGIALVSLSWVKHQGLRLKSL